MRRSLVMLVFPSGGAASDTVNVGGYHRDLVLVGHLENGFKSRNHCVVLDQGDHVHPASGWDRKPTTRLTTFMMTTKFKGVLVARIGAQWHFTAPLTGKQQQYVRALGLSEKALLRKGAAPVQKLLGKRL